MHVPLTSEEAVAKKCEKITSQGGDSVVACENMINSADTPKTTEELIVEEKVSVDDSIAAKKLSEDSIVTADPPACVGQVIY